MYLKLRFAHPSTTRPIDHLLFTRGLYHLWRHRAMDHSWDVSTAIGVHQSTHFSSWTLGLCHALTLESLFLLSILLGQGVTWVGKSMFLFLCWPSMVPNQRQLFIVVSDWGSYLGSPFSHLLLWDHDFVSCCIACRTLRLFIFCCFFGVHQNKETKSTTETAPPGAKHTKQKINTHETRVGKGYLSMILNQRQLKTPASDWEPYQAKHKTQHRKTNIDNPPNSHPDHTKTRSECDTGSLLLCVPCHLWNAGVRYAGFSNKEILAL